MTSLNGAEFCLLIAAFVTCLIAGTLHVRVNLSLLAIVNLLIAGATFFVAHIAHDSALNMVAILIIMFKAFLVPIYLARMANSLGATRDPGNFLAAPLSMHLCLSLMILSLALARSIPNIQNSCMGACFSISMLLSGLTIMLTRKLAITHIVGFLIVENGIYAFALTQTRGMPLLVEMGILLDLLVAVMVYGLLIFKIQKSFEHIDVSQLRDLKD